MFGSVKDTLEGKMSFDAGRSRSDGDGNGLGIEVETVGMRVHSSSWTIVTWSVWCTSMTRVIMS